MLRYLLAQGNIILYTGREFVKSLQTCKLCLRRAKLTGLVTVTLKTTQHKNVTQQNRPRKWDEN